MWKSQCGGKKQQRERKGERRKKRERERGKKEERKLGKIRQICEKDCIEVTLKIITYKNIYVIPI